jgi:polyisoprenoid-binding protein YceI
MLQLATLTFFVLGVSTALAGNWAVVHDNSQLGFVAKWEDEPFEGVFKDWQADLTFHPRRPEDSRFEVSVDMFSADTRSAERDAELVKPDWFGADRFPRATFVTDELRRVGEDRYEATGTLTIKDVAQEVVLPFTWVQNGDRARLKGAVTIDRTGWQVGEGEWRDDDVIGHGVRVVVDLTLTAS